MDRQTDKWTNGQTDRQTDKSTDVGERKLKGNMRKQQNYSHTKKCKKVEKFQGMIDKIYISASKQ